ncbi:MAG TPA: hypothetical protein VGO40_16685 [Longimicrobium sp.]|nr:hypothetical protein [Longimicrobium sp.]
MRKQKLDVDHLHVESFETGHADGLRGTVRANMTGPTRCDPDTCETRRGDSCDFCGPSGYVTCEAGVGTCGLSCNPSCVVTWCGCAETDTCA